MSMWPFVKLGSLADFKNGLNFSSENFGRGVKVIGVTDFQDYFYPRYDEVKEINPNGIVRDVDYLEDEDVLFVRSNGNPNLIGRSLFIKKLPEKMSHSGFTIRLRFKSDKIFPPFYVYLFKSSLIRAVLSIYGGGTNINNLNQKILGNLDVPKPELATQKKIAAILSAYDELIENNQRRIVLLEKLAEEIYREWFVRLRFPGHDKVNVAKGVPAGWSMSKLSEIYTTTSGGTPSRTKPEYYNGTIPWVKTGELQNRFILSTEESITSAGLENSSAKTFPAKTILVAMYGATIGQVGILGIEAATNQACCALLPKHAYLGYSFSFHLMKSLKDWFVAVSFGGAQQNISQDVIRRCEVLLPPQAVVENFCTVVDPMLSSIEALARQTELLANCRDKLLPRLISGKLSVENLDIQFPPGMAEELNAEPSATANA